LARYLGADDAIATRAAIDSDGYYTGDVEFYAYGPYKAAAVRGAAENHRIDLAESYAYSDSATDLPMLECVGHPTVVNPDRELRRIAAERGWEVRAFQRPVPLRGRMPRPRPAPTIAISGGVLAIVALGATSWWWLRKPKSRC
jgi:phosphoserine phosphatase